MTTATAAADLVFPPPFIPRFRAALRAGLTLMRDHTRLDQVLVFAINVNASALARAVEHFSKTEAGQRLLQERPRIDRTHVDFDALRALPDGTLGREYVRFLEDNAIGPEPFEELPNIGDERAAWMILRLRQTHDLWHVVTGYRADVEGELLLQAFTYAQIKAPSAWLLTFFGTLRWKRSLAHLRALRHAYGRGKAAAFFPPFRWEEHWSSRVEDVRKLLRVAA